MLKNVKLIELPKVSDSRGHLTFIENLSHIPFSIKRVYYLYDVPFDGDRGGHAHKKLRQLIIPVAGSFDLKLSDGIKQKIYHMNNPAEGLYICPMIWRNLTNFSPGAVCMVFASEFYDPNDYIRSYDKFVEIISEENHDSLS